MTSLADGYGDGRLQRAAPALLALRVALGLGAWVLFNAFFPAPFAVSSSVAAVFVIYLLANLLLALRYRAAPPRPNLIAADLTANVLLPLVPAVFAGATTSPLLAPLLLHLGLYATVHSPRATAAAGAIAAGGLVLLAAGEAAGVFPAASSASVLDGWRIALPVLLLAAPMLPWWARRRSSAPQALPTAPPAPGGTGGVAGSEAETVPGAVANALLAVSDVVSRLTLLDEILENVVEVAPRSLGADFCGIALWNEDTGTYTGSVAAGAAPEVNRRFAGMQWSPEEAPEFEWARRLGKCTIAQPSERTRTAELDIPAVLISPLSSGRSFFGVIQFARRGAGPPFTQRDFTIADGIARQTAVALERARLLEGSRMLVRALESTGEAVLITDAARRVVFANPAFLKTFGYTLEAVLGRDLAQIAGSDAEWLRGLDPGRATAGWRGETLMPDAHGAAVPVLIDVSHIGEAQSPPQGAVVTLKDISAEKAFQEQMQRADRLKAVGEIAAGLAHEINNALTAIFGQTRQRLEFDDAQLRPALDRIDAQARRIAGIVQDVLGFARPRPPEPRPGDLGEVVAHTVDLVCHDCERQDVRIALHVEPDLPRARIDRAQVQQVLLNLLGNALQSLGGRGGEIRVEVVRSADDLAVHVVDDGPGIPAEIFSRIFDPFFSTKAEGTGLGLSVSYAIARSHGGDLRAGNEPGGGARFTLVLPAAREPGGALARNVLVVDDDPEVAESIAQMLEAEGVRVERAATAAAALERAENGGLDAVFLDLRLPDQPGTEVYEEIARRQPALAARVVFVTGGLWRADSRLRGALPTRRVLAKPCTPEQVREVLREIAAESAQERSEAGS